MSSSVPLVSGPVEGPAYSPFLKVENGASLKYTASAAMPAYRNRSFEESRVEDCAWTQGQSGRLFIDSCLWNNNFIWRLLAEYISPFSPATTTATFGSSTPFASATTSSQFGTTTAASPFGAKPASAL
jgi:hypothetical protein